MNTQYYSFYLGFLPPHCPYAATVAPVDVGALEDAVLEVLLTVVVEDVVDVGLVVVLEAVVVVDVVLTVVVGAAVEVAVVVGAGAAPATSPKKIPRPLVPM